MNQMEKGKWQYIKDTYPLAWEIDEWDGKRSSLIVIECKDGEQYLGYYLEGIQDGKEFKDFYTKEDYSIDKEVLRFMELPD